jgi:hypothetical protein
VHELRRPHRTGHRAQRALAVGRGVVEDQRVRLERHRPAAQRRALGVQRGQAGQGGEDDVQAREGGRTHAMTACQAACSSAT